MLLAKQSSPHETVNDLHGDLVNLALVVQAEDLSVQLYSRLHRTLCHELLFRECRDWWIRRGDWDGVPDVERAWRYFVVSWMGMNGISGTMRFNHSYAVCWQKKGGNRATRFVSAVESLPSWHERLRRVVILHRCGLDVLANIEDLPGCAIYVDPPYLLDTRAKTGGGGVYQHDFAAADHERLAGLLHRFRRARVVLSYYDSPELDRLYPGWTKLTHLKLARRQMVKRLARDVQAPECLLINGEAYGQTRGLFDKG